jgi:hypothetical protein
MKSGGKGLMNVCYDRYNKTPMQTKTMATATTTSKVKKVVKTKTYKK